MKNEKKLLTWLGRLDDSLLIKARYRRTVGELDKNFVC